jgi:hypothetical protein
MRSTTVRHLVLAVAAATALSAAGNAAAALSKLPPASLARQVYQAWHANSRPAALKVADKEAVDKLFGVHWRAMKFGGCHPRDEGGFECVYKDAKDDFSLAMIVDGGASLGGYNVATVSFSTEE